MKKTVKATLYSTLIFPGVGHFSLDRYRRGLIIFLPAFLSFVFLLHNALSKAFALTDKIQRGELPQDPQAIALLIAAEPTSSELLMLRIATWVLLVCWISGIIDAYRLGKIADQAQSEQEKQITMQ